MCAKYTRLGQLKGKFGVTKCLGRCGWVWPVLWLVSMVEGGLCCCLFVSFEWVEGKVWLLFTIFTCLVVCGWREEGSRGCSMVMGWPMFWSLNDSLVSLYDGFFFLGGGGGAVVATVGLTCASISQWYICQLVIWTGGGGRGVVMVVGHLWCYLSMF